MHPKQWHEAKDAGRGTRTSYKTRDYRDYLYPVENAYPASIFQDEEGGGGPQVSYTLQKEIYLTPPTIGVLTLNRQTRAEAIPIFYGGKEIRFHSMSAVLPFLRDRSELSLQSMQYFHLDLEVYDGQSQTRRRQEGWAQTFTEFPKFGPLNLQTLSIRIRDPFCHYAWKLRLDSKKQRWVHEMAKNITNLDKLGVTFYFSVVGGRSPNEEVKENSPTERLLWEFLAPKMLKQVGDEPHDAHSLLKRRIRDREDAEDLDEEELSL